jgi:hypothetical protein
MEANPVTINIIAIVALIAIIVLLATKTQFFQTIWEAMKVAAVAVWDAIKVAIQWVIDIIQVVITWVQEKLILAWTVMKMVAQNVWDGIKEFIQSGIDKIKEVISWIKDKISDAWNSVKDTAERVWNTIKDAIQSVIDFIGRLIDKITGIRFPSPPSWMTSIFGGSGEAEFKFLPPDVMRFIPDVFQRFDAAPAQITAASSSPLGLGTTFGRASTGNVVQNVTNVNITVEGAIDPLSTAKQITQLLKQQGITVGSTNARTF